MDRALFRALFFIVVMFHISMFIWEPRVYADKIGGFNCAGGLIYLVIMQRIRFTLVLGFKPILWLWQLLFQPILVWYYTSLFQLDVFFIR